MLLHAGPEGLKVSKVAESAKAMGLVASDWVSNRNSRSSQISNAIRNTDMFTHVGDHRYAIAAFPGAQHVPLKPTQGTLAKPLQHDNLTLFLCMPMSILLCLMSAACCSQHHKSKVICNHIFAGLKQCDSAGFCLIPATVMLLLLPQCISLVVVLKCTYILCRSTSKLYRRLLHHVLQQH